MNLDRLAPFLHAPTAGRWATGNEAPARPAHPNRAERWGKSCVVAVADAVPRSLLYGSLDLGLETSLSFKGCKQFFGFAHIFNNKSPKSSVKAFFFSLFYSRLE